MARSVRDRTGEKYGRLTPSRYFFRENDKGKNIVFWYCDCDCGTKDKIVRGTDLGNINSCGCLSVESNRVKAENNKTHGLSGTRFYKIWRATIDRCTNENIDSFKTYGARGIKVSEDWLKFENFRDDMYESYVEQVKEHGESNTSIERIDVDKGYSKENCRWEIWYNQSRNRTTNREFEANNPSFGTFRGKVIVDFAMKHNLDPSLITKCLKGTRKATKGWTFKYL